MGIKFSDKGVGHARYDTSATLDTVISGLQKYIRRNKNPKGQWLKGRSFVFNNPATCRVTRSKRFGFIGSLSNCSQLDVIISLHYDWHPYAKPIKD